jgi:hypothetical protein
MNPGMLRVFAITVVVPVQAATQSPASWQIGDAPIVSVGANEEFASITSGAFFSDGGFVIADVMNARLAVFNAEGRLQKMIGRSGAGPGEFQNLAWARAYRGDSITTYDRAQRRVTVFGRSGDRVRTVVIESPGNGLGPEALAVLDDGRILVQATRSIGAETAAPGVHSAAMELWIYSADGEPLNRIASNLVNLQWVKLGSPRLLMPRPFAIVSLIATNGSSVFVADSSDTPIRELNAAGAEVRRIGTRSTSRTASADHIAAYRERELATARRSTNTNAVAMQTRILDATPFPDHVPALRRMFVDRDYRLWVEAYPEARSTRQRFRVHGRDGRLLASAVGPERGRVLDVYGSRALVAWSDPDGVPYIRVHPIQVK